MAYHFMRLPADCIANKTHQHCYRKGIAVPQQLSIVSYDDIRAASYVNPPLTTVRQPLRRMGGTAMEMLGMLILTILLA